MTSLSITLDEVDSYLGEQQPDLTEMSQSVFAAVERSLFPGTLGGQAPLEALTQYYHSRFLPYARAQALKGRKDAQAVLAVLDEKSPEITSAAVAAFANLALKMLEGPSVPARQAVIGLGAILLMIGLRAKKKQREIP